MIMLRPKVNRVELVQPVGKRPGRRGRHQQNICAKESPETSRPGPQAVKASAGPAANIRMHSS